MSLRIEVEWAAPVQAPTIPLGGTLVLGENILSPNTQSSAIPSPPGTQVVVARLRNIGSAPIFVRLGYQDPAAPTQLRTQPDGAGVTINVAQEPRRRLDPGEAQVLSALGGARFIWSTT